LLLSPSKGKWVWANLRRKNIAFSKVGSFPLAGDRDLTDEELFKEIKRQKIAVQPVLLASLLSTIIVKERVSFLSTLLTKEDLLLKGIIAGNMASLI